MHRQLVAEFLPVLPVDFFESFEGTEESREFLFEIDAFNKPVFAPVLPDRGRVAPEFSVGGAQVEVVKIVDKAIELFGDFNLRISESGETEGFKKRFLRRVLLFTRSELPFENGLIDSGPGDCGLVFIHHLEVTREPELGGEGPEDVREKAVEGPEEESRHA